MDDPFQNQIQKMDDPFEKLPEEVLQLIFLAVSDCKTLVRCMAVSRSFKEHSQRVSKLSIICPGHFTSYAEKLDSIYNMVRGFRCLEVLMVRVGQPKDEPPSWARCMRYAEIGSSVQKFIFMAAKSGEFSELDSALRNGFIPDGTDRKETEVQRRPQNSVDAAAAQVEEETCSLDSSQTPGNRCEIETGVVDFNLRQVLAPSNDVLKRMVPVIVFAIVQGLDEFRDSVPCFINKFRSLKTFLLVDMLESVTVFMREHQIQQMRSVYQQAESSSAQRAAEYAATESNELVDPDVEQSQMFKHDRHPESLGNNDSRGKAVETEDESSSSTRAAVDTRSKGKELETAHEENSSSQGCLHGESFSGSVSPRSDDDEEDEVTSPLRRPYADVVRTGLGQAEDSSVAGPHQAEGDERTSSDDGAEGWRYCRGISIHEAADGGDFVSKYRRNLKSRENRLMKVGGYRRRERSTDWVDESVRRRQESRTYRAASYRRREESRANKYWRPEGRDGEHDLSSSSSSSSFPPFSGVSSRQEHVRLPFGLVPLRSCATSDEGSRKEDKDNSPSSSSGHAINQSEGDATQKDISSSSHLIQNEKIDSTISSDKVNNNLESCSSETNHLRSSKNNMDESSSSSSNNQLSSDKDNLCSSGNSCRSNEHKETNNYHPNDDDSSSKINEDGSSSSGNQRERQPFRWGRSDSDAQSSSSTNNNSQRVNMDDRFNAVGSPATAATAAGFRGGRMNHWRETWGETWGERLGRRARELRSAAAMAAAVEAEEGVRARERVREGVRKRQREIEREALRFDITFWRAESVVAPRCGYRLADVSMCIATHGARSLGSDEVEVLVSSALAGPLLAATIAHVNEQASFHNL